MRERREAVTAPEPDAEDCWPGCRLRRLRSRICPEAVVPIAAPVTLATDDTRSSAPVLTLQML